MIGPRPNPYQAWSFDNKKLSLTRSPLLPVTETRLYFYWLPIYFQGIDMHFLHQLHEEHFFVRK